MTNLIKSFHQIFSPVNYVMTRADRILRGYDG